MLKFSSTLTALFSVLACMFLFPTVVKATAFTYNVASNENACFYLWSPSPGKKIGFYFAVQQGGSFDIDYNVKAPNGEVIMEGEEEKELDVIFTATQYGEYEFCFSNERSTWTDKLIDFEIILENENKVQFTDSPKEAEVTKMDDIMNRIHNALTAIQRSQKHFRSRENRNSYTVSSTESRIFWFAIFESLSIVTMAALQVYVIKNFFKTKRGGV